MLTQSQTQSNGASFIRHNSTESLVSLNSIYSQQSFQSANMANNKSDTNAATHSNSNSPSKKRSWLRSSFNKAFNRKQKPGDLTADNRHLNNVVNNAHNQKQFLSDVEENDSIKNLPVSLYSPNASHFSHQQQLYANEYEEHVNFIKANALVHGSSGANGFGGDYSLPNSPMHQIMQ